MTPPPLLLCCTLLFWGWQGKLLTIAIPMALILETARWVKWRWTLSDKDFNRVTDFTSLSFILITIYLINQQSYGLMTLLNWLPMLFFLLILAQTYSTHGTIKLSSLFLSLRHYEKVGKPHPKASVRINLTYPYLMMCLLSASASNNSWFFLGVCLLVAWGLWAARPKRYPAIFFGLLLAIAGTLAYFGQMGLQRLQSQVEQIIISWFEDMFFADRDPYRQYTAIGDIGQLKQSDKILLRVDTPYPLLLREASYNTYLRSNWLAKPFKLNTVYASGEATWTFSGDKFNAKGENITISAYLRKGKGMLAMPHGTYQVSDLPVLNLQRNDFGAVKIENGPGLVRYTAYIGENTPLDVPPTSRDLQLPFNENLYLIELSEKLKLPQQSPQQALNTLTKFFNQFQYSLKLTAPKEKVLTPLEYFLGDSRAGHCEYFATATVLLLRAAGIPARYAVGYAVVEFSDLENVYVVRKRHAHAWTLVYINGRWQEFDTTPPAWVGMEEEMAGWWESLDDLWSWLTYQFSKWRWREGDSTNEWLLWLILPLSLILIWRFYTREKVARSQKSIGQANAPTAGIDSAFYKIVQQLNAAGYIRQPGETLTAWLKRIEMSNVDMQTMLALHQRYRFDPVGISVQERAVLTAQVKTWLQKNCRPGTSE